MTPAERQLLTVMATKLAAVLSDAQRPADAKDVDRVLGAVFDESRGTATETVNPRPGEFQIALLGDRYALQRWTESSIHFVPTILAPMPVECGPCWETIGHFASLREAEVALSVAACPRRYDHEGKPA